MSAVHREVVTDMFGSYERVWACTPPDTGVAFFVVRDEWDQAYSVRTIHEWKSAA